MIGACVSLEEIPDPIPVCFSGSPNSAAKLSSSKLKLGWSEPSSITMMSLVDPFWISTELIASIKDLDAS